MNIDMEKVSQQLRRFGEDISRNSLESWVQARGPLTVESFVSGVGQLPWGKHITPEKAMAAMYRFEAQDSRRDDPLDKKNRTLGRFLGKFAVLDTYSAAIIGMQADGIGEERITPEEIRLQKMCELSPTRFFSRSTKALKYLQEGLREDLFEMLRAQGMDPRQEDSLLQGCLHTRPYNKEHPWMGLTSRFGIDIISVLGEDGHRVLHPVKYDVLTDGKDEYGISESKAYELALLWAMLKMKGDVSDGIVCRRIAVPTSNRYMEMIPLMVEEDDLKRLAATTVRACDDFWNTHLIGNTPVPLLEKETPPPFSDEQMKQYKELATKTGRALALVEEAEEAAERAKGEMLAFVQQTLGVKAWHGFKFPSDQGVTVTSRKNLHWENIGRLLDTVPGIKEAALIPTMNLDPEKVQSFLEEPEVKALMSDKGLREEDFCALEVDKNRLLRFITDHPEMGISPESLYSITTFVSRSLSKVGKEAMGRIKDDIQSQNIVESFISQPDNVPSEFNPPHFL